MPLPLRHGPTKSSPAFSGSAFSEILVLQIPVLLFPVLHFQRSQKQQSAITLLVNQTEEKRTSLCWASVSDIKTAVVSHI